MGRKKAGDLLAFCHIPKSGGITLTHLLRRHFGMGHVDLGFRPGRAITLQELRRDLRMHPFARSVAGHFLQPHVDFAGLARRLRWYTFVREPVARFLSHFQYHVGRRNEPHDLARWVETYGPPARNRQVTILAGEPDVEAAKQILEETCDFVGLQDEYDASLVLWRDRLGLHDFNLAYGHRKNASRLNLRDRILERWDEYKGLILECNSLDCELYAFVKDHLWPRQVEAFGRERLQDEVKAALTGPTSSLAGRVKYALNAGYRNTVYKPALRLQGRVTQ